MENASKALIMAGSILMAILVIGLLVFGYQQLSSLQQTETDAEDNDKLARYMNQFEQFGRTLYGSELLSLANLQEDYNTSDARINTGYDKVEITVTITNEIDAQISDKVYFQPNTYDLSEIVEDAKKLEEERAKYEEPKRAYNNKSVKYYAGKSNREIAIDLLGIEPPSNYTNYQIENEILVNDKTTSDLLAEIHAYTSLNSTYTEFRTGKQFDCVDIGYNTQNGRINKMVFVEI